MYLDRLGRPLSVGDHVMVFEPGSSLYTYWATISRIVKSRVYYKPHNRGNTEWYKTNTSHFLYLNDQVAANSIKFPELYI